MKKRIAYFTPLSPQHCGISDHSQELLPHLAQYADIDIMISGDYTPTDSAIREQFRIVDYKEYLRDPTVYDAAVYQVGNNLRFHAYMIPCLRAAPGIVVLQDYCLQYLVLGMTLGRGEKNTLIEALRPAYGQRATSLVRKLLLGIENPINLSFAYPFLAAARGIIVHSKHMYDLVKEDLPGKPVSNVAMGVATPPRTASKKELRERYGYSDDAFIVASVSTRAPKKHLDIVLEALRDARNKIPNLKFLVVGGGSPGAKVHRMIRDYGLSDIVEQTGWVESDRYQDLIRLSDVSIDIRDMLAAETAHSVLRCLAAGTPVLVSASGTLLEIPDSCSLKIKPDNQQADVLRGHLVELAQQPQKVSKMAAAALDYADSRLTMEIQAKEFMAFVEEIVESTEGVGKVELLEPEPGHAKRLIAGLYAFSRVVFLLRSYGVSDSLRRMRLKLATRLKPADPEII